ncbi:hypothetical protein [Paenibacillus dendritiformis]|uniref:hypothetical protein n=1 Tax=Paenibacillus dendritiformis TaxID=130049 RepID=UPI00387E0266
MKLAFKNQSNGLYIKRYYNVAGHWHRFEHTDNIQEAFLYDRELYYKPQYQKEESYIQEEIRLWNERNNELIVPIEVVVSLK